MKLTLQAIFFPVVVDIAKDLFQMWTKSRDMNEVVGRRRQFLNSDGHKRALCAVARDACCGRKSLSICHSIFLNLVIPL